MLPPSVAYERDDSPKLPPSPVLKALANGINDGHADHSRSALSRKHSQKNVIYKKVSNRLMSDSSSSSDDDDYCRMLGRSNTTKSKSSGSNPKQHSTSSNESTSPRTPNSFKILSGKLRHNENSELDERKKLFARSLFLEHNLLIADLYLI